jgi:hypothetical protein
MNLTQISPFNVSDVKSATCLGHYRAITGVAGTGHTCLIAKTESIVRRQLRCHGIRALAQRLGVRSRPAFTACLSFAEQSPSLLQQWRIELRRAGRPHGYRDQALHLAELVGDRAQRRAAEEGDLR